MSLINQADSDANWREVLALWERIANWITYRTSEAQLRQQIKAFLVFLWSEKEWLKEQYPTKARKIEQAIGNSTHMGVAIDLANTVKHRRLRKPQRTSAADTEFYGRVTVGGGVTRRLYYIAVGGSRHIEIMQVLRGAIDELEHLRLSLREGSI